MTKIMAGKMIGIMTSLITEIEMEVSMEGLGTTVVDQDVKDSPMID